MEPWKLMLGLAGILALYGVALMLGISTPAQAAVFLFALVLFGLTMYIGFQLGNQFAKARNQ